MPMPPPPELAAMTLEEVARATAEQRLPPVDTWNPARSGDSEMRILADGTWLHQGAPIHRPEMVRLFSTILRRETDGGYALVTPVELLSIAVDDAPFLATSVKSEGAGRQRRLAFQLNTGDLVVAGPANPLDFGERPALGVRPGLDARVARSVYYELAELALDEAHDPPGLWSNGAFFAMPA